MPLITALSQSYNLATAHLGLDLGLGEVMEMFKRLGIHRPLLAVPSMLLGSAELAPIEVASMYQTIAAGGVYTPLRTIYAISDADGNLLARYPQQPRQVVDPAAVHLLQYAMMETMRTGTGKTAYQVLAKDYQVAGKTGTSNQTRDSWFAGFAGDYSAVVWIGADNFRSTGLTGAQGALRVWRQFMAEASSQPLPTVPVRNVNYVWANAATGELSESYCANAKYMPFIEGSEPRKNDSCREAEKRWRWRW